MNVAKVLIVDDEPFNRDIIAEYIEDKNYAIEVAEDGEIAWQKLTTPDADFDVVILDRMMPKMDGMELIAKMKVDAMLESIPVIFQTALSSKEEIKEGLAAGAYYYLTKPFEEEMLLSVLSTAVSDRLRYKKMQQASDEAIRGFKLLTQGHFTFKDVDEARELASSVSNIFPDHRRVVVGLTELLLNAVEHGNLAISYDEKTKLKANGCWNEEVEKRLQDSRYADRRVSLSFEKNDRFIKMLIKDQGGGFDWSDFLEMSPARAFDTHGRGIAVANMMSFDSLEYYGCGNEVEVCVDLTKDKQKGS